MIRNREAFTKRWALFCAGKQFTENDMVFRGRILENEDLRNKECKRASFRFCSFFYANLSGSCIRAGGDFTGNGWEDCQLTGVDYTGLTIEMDTYSRCIFGNARLYDIRMLEITVQNCSFVGNVWKNMKVRNSVFSDCNLRGIHMRDCALEKTCFENCIFDRAELEGLICSEVVFKNCRFTENIKKTFPGCIFQECNFEKY